jgi:hypothetical protein
MEKEINEIVKNIRFRGFEGLNIKNLLYLPSEIYRCKDQSLLHILKNFVNNYLGNNFEYDYSVNKKSKILYVISHHFKRKDNLELVKSLVHLNKQSDFFYPKLHSNIKFNFRNIFLYDRNIFSWFKSLHFTTLSLKEKFLIISNLLDLYRLMKIYEEITFEKYKLLVVPFDANSSLNLLVQIFKKKSIYTATLQHGVFLKKRDVKNIEYSGVEFNNFISDYFLAWNNFTVEEALNSGINKDKIKLVGIPKYINTKRPSETFGGNYFGVVLNTMNSHLQNIELIKNANELSQIIKIKYKIKYHPRFKGTEYNDFISEKNYAGPFPIETSVNNYAKSVKFSLISNSTVLMELAFLKHPSYILKFDDNLDKYSSCNFAKFSDVNELLLKMEDKNEQFELWNYLCSVSEPRKTYENFLNQFLIE